MKIILTTVLLLATTWAKANLVMSQTFTPADGTITDGNPVGQLFSGTFNQTGFDNPVVAATVTVNVSGGYNADLYAYLVAPNGTKVDLMNMPGTAVNVFGASGAGMNITFQDGTSDNGNIEDDTSSSVLFGSYNAVGSLASVNGATANGDWGVFFADMTSGGGNETLVNWTLTLTVVPEPVTVALVIFAAGFFPVAGLRQIRRLRRSS